MPGKFLNLKVLKTKMFLAVVLAMAFFVSVGIVLAVNDNANEPLCNTWNCDGSSIICSNLQFDWTSNGYPGGAGNKNCCGDDSYEELRGRVLQTCFGNECPSAFSEDLSDISCCDTPRCVYNGECYQTGSYSINGDNILCVGAVWADSDMWIQSYANYCETLGGYHRSPAGESGVGEYGSIGTIECCGDDSGEYEIDGICCNSASDHNSSGHCCPSGTEWNGSTCASSEPDENQTLCSFSGYVWFTGYYEAGNPFCCGDDSSEYFMSRQVEPNDPPSTGRGVSFGSDSSDNAYCGWNKDCVYQGQCFTQNSGSYSLGGESAVVCINNLWWDCDSVGTVCEGSNRCNLPGRWVFSGESVAHGEYQPSGNDNLGCCGDDANEIYVSKDCQGRKITLCCSASKPFVKNGRCVSSCNGSGRKSAVVK